MDAYPEGDKDFEVVTISKVSKEDSGWSIKRDDGWSFFVPSNSPVEPVVGMAARFYGKGLGFVVRGLFLGGERVYYRTKDEDKVHQEISMYGKDAADWLARWDAGQTVWSIEMGGLGPGYEQAIQITAAEILRHLLDKKYDYIGWKVSEAWKRDSDLIEKAGFENNIIKKMGLSGAQWGGALNIATNIYRDGPRKIMTDDRVKDRHIQIRREFPSVATDA